MAVAWMWLIVFATCIETTAGTFSLRVPDGPISAPLGGSVVLSSVVSPSFDPDEVHWHRPGQYDNPILLYKNKKIQDEAGEPQYRGRAFFTAGLQKGDASMRLENLTLADRGLYVCTVQSTEWYEEANVSLTVRVTGSIPVMSFRATETGEHVNVTCVSDGWTPAPTVTWRDENNNEIKQNSNQVHFYDDDGFVGVSSWLLYSFSESERLSCSVGLSDQERKEGHILLTKNVIIQSGNLAGPLIITLLLLLMLMIGIFILYRKGIIKFPVASKRSSSPTKTTSSPGENPAEAETLLQKGNMELKKKTVEKGTKIEEKEQVKIYVNTEDVRSIQEWKDVQEYKVKNISLNPNTVHVLLEMLEDQTKQRVKSIKPQKPRNPEDKFPLVLSCESFEHGQHFWGVNFWGEEPENHSNKDKGLKNSWFVGVCRDPAVQTQRFPLTPQNGFWGLQYERETGLFANTDPPTPVPMSKQMLKQLRRVGVFLDCDKHILSFYNVDTHSHLCTFKSVFPNRLFAVISPGVRDREVMQICSDVENLTCDL